MVGIASVGGPEADAGVAFENQIVSLKIDRSTEETPSTAAIEKGDLLVLVLSSGVYTTVRKTNPDDGGVQADRLPGVILGVALEGGSNGSKIRVGLKGVFDVLSGVVSVGQALYAGDTEGILAAAITNPTNNSARLDKRVGVCLEASASLKLGSVLFDGINGFGAAGD